jgi:hypothetical protein
MQLAPYYPTSLVAIDFDLGAEANLDLSLAL